MASSRWMRGVAVVSGLLALLITAGWLYARGFELQPPASIDPKALAEDLPFLQHDVPERGRMLAVVSSAARFPDGGRGGFELTELARAYWVFEANGYRVDIASPAGGAPTPVIDRDDMENADYAFLNDPQAQRKVTATLALSEVDPANYAGVYFVGGKGAMIDFVGNPDIGRIVRHLESVGGVVGAVCHGPAALLGLRREDGLPFLSGRRATGFSNAEELFLTKDAREAFPFLLQEAMAAEGARFIEGEMYLDNTVVDGLLVTGQNPWSSWSSAEAMVGALGHQPVPRRLTPQERSVRVLLRYRKQGYDAARALLAEQPLADRRLLLMHAMVAAMRGDVSHAFQLQRLARA